MFSALKDALVGGSSAVIQVVSGTDQREASVAVGIPEVILGSALNHQN